MLKNLVKSLNNPLASLASETVFGADCGFVDSGSYTINALLSGSLFGGYPDNKITFLAGPSGTGKSRCVIQSASSFQKRNPKAEIVFFESEGALTTMSFSSVGMDLERIAVIPISTIEEFKTQAAKIAEEYSQLKIEDRNPLMMILDSAGNLSTTKEITDSTNIDSKKDMTRAAQFKATFRILTLKLATLNIPLIATNHTYQTQEMFSKTIMSGGTGPEYTGSSILILSKSKQKEGEGADSVVIGIVMTARADKSRFTKPFMKAETLIRFEGGFDRYYGLFDLALEFGFIKQEGKKYLLNGSSEKFWRKEIEENPEVYFTQEFLEKLDVTVQKKFKYSAIDPKKDSKDAED